MRKAPLLSLLALVSLSTLGTPSSAANGAEYGVQADAGPDRYIVPPDRSVTLQGRVRGINVAQVPPQATITWTQLSGAPATIENDTTLRPVVTPGEPGRIRLLLKVVVQGVGWDFDQVVIHSFGTAQNGLLHGELRKWQKVMLTFNHDEHLSEGGTPNPFLDLRLSTLFYHPASSTLYDVPGFFVADGNPAETSGTSGPWWRVQFTPDRSGTWYYLASFRSGTEIAIDFDPEAGQGVSFDGANGTFDVGPVDPNAPGFLSRGRLEYAGTHYLHFAETGEPYLKNGAGSPENFLGYFEFDQTFDQGGATNDLPDGLHHYEPHVGDYVDLGVPLWKAGFGRGIFGALNYLGSRGVNSLFTLTYNIDGGDGREVWPWMPATNKLRFDVSKLAQWQRVVDHMMRAGIVWHAVTQEAENDGVLDGGNLGVQRKLYFRELVARFAHAPGLVWNLGEENDNTNDQRIAFADYIRAVDPYDHPIALHNYPGNLQPFFALLGTHLELCSLQGDPVMTPLQVRQLIDASAEAGRPWMVNFDEQNPAIEGVVPDSVDFWHDEMRQEALWPTLLGKGGGVDWYFGYAYPDNDLDCENYRTRENLFDLTARAVDFVRSHVPVEEMEHADSLAIGNGPSVLAKPGEFYLVYLPFGGIVSLDLGGHAGPFRVSWFDAREGGGLQNGTVTQVSGPGFRSLGLPPGSADWCAFVRRSANFAPSIQSVTIDPATFEAGMDFTVQVRATDPNGPSDTLSVQLQFFDPNNASFLAQPAMYRGGNLYSVFFPDAPGLVPGEWRIDARVTDEGGLTTTQSATFVAQ